MVTGVKRVIVDDGADEVQVDLQATVSRTRAAPCHGSAG
jgi:hypothetical protein